MTYHHRFVGGVECPRCQTVTDVQVVADDTYRVTPPYVFTCRTCQLAVTVEVRMTLVGVPVPDAPTE